MNVLKDTLSDLIIDTVEAEQNNERGGDWMENIIEEYVERIEGEMIGKYFLL